MKTLKVGIASLEAIKRRTLAIARGRLKPARDDPKVWFTSPESFPKVLSNKNRALLNVIAATHPDSLQDLAARTGRKPSNLSRTLRTMERYGFVRLHKGRAWKNPAPSAVSRDYADAPARTGGIVLHPRPPA